MPVHTPPNALGALNRLRENLRGWEERLTRAVEAAEVVAEYERRQQAEEFDNRVDPAGAQRRADWLADHAPIAKAAQGVLAEYQALVGCIRQDTQAAAQAAELAGVPAEALLMFAADLNDPTGARPHWGAARAVVERALIVGAPTLSKWLPAGRARHVSARRRVTVAEADALMREALEDSSADVVTRVSWTASKWSQFIHCSASTIVKTATWKKCEPARRRREADGRKRRR